MVTYHKIQTVFKRDPETKYKTLLMEEYSLPEFLYLQNNDWVFTEKVDGTNIRILWKDSTFEVRGKSDNAQLPNQLLINLTEYLSDKSEIFNEIFSDKDVCLYGEGYGGKIQKAGATYGVEQRFVLFDVLIGNVWLKRIDIEQIASKLNMEIVPIIGVGTLSDMVKLVRDTKLISKWGNFEMEGLVARPLQELKTRFGDRVITKLKKKDFKD